MSSKKTKEKRPVLAICYDFDKTLSPDDMQAQGFIQEVYEGDVETFWKESSELARRHEMDSNLAYMYKMIQEAQGQIVFTKKALEEYGAKVTLFPGVDGWFERIRRYGAECGVTVEHYIISSGLKEMIEGTKVAKEGAFKKVFASSFMFNEHGVAVWPAQAINYTNKTQYLFRIEKGIFDVNDNRVNDHFEPEDIRVPFRNMVYIGDSDTDIPCMILVNKNGGHAIGVYNADTADKTKMYKMMREKRIKYFAPADYSENSELDRLLHTIIEHTALNEKLEAHHTANKKETNEVYGHISAEQRRKTDLIIDLENSTTFSRTHDVIADLREFSDFGDKERELLCKIAKSNSQVRYLLRDEDVHGFYQSLLADREPVTPVEQTIKKLLDKYLPN